MLFIFQIIYWITVAFAAVFALLILFEPPLRYIIRDLPADPNSAEFLHVVAALADAQFHRCSNVELLCDGIEFYPAELAAIETAVRSIHLESFTFLNDAVGNRFLNALTTKARQGVKVRLIVDAFGSFLTPDRCFKTLRDAGGDVRWYQPFHVANLKRLNNRTHRKLIIVDGNIGFVGGAGIGNFWETAVGRKPPWRDMMFKVAGHLATGLQTSFAENWLESSGEILTDADNFPKDNDPDTGSAAGMVVISSPTAGRSSRSRILFQVLMAAARKSIDIHSPYFLPDRSATAELVHAVKERGVKVRIIVPGPANNHPFSRLASRRRYGPLLKAGVEIHEYQPGMIHTKSLTVDSLWVVVGSTNFDSRSFDLNDEVNMVAVDRTLAAQVEKQFAADLSHCQRVDLERWSHRSLAERALAQAARILERQE